MIPVVEDGWSARDERRLLDLVATCGYGNWGDISRKLNRTPEVRSCQQKFKLRALIIFCYLILQECSNHYDNFHLTCEENVDLPASLPPHLIKLTSDQPPRMVIFITEASQQMN